MTAITKDTDYQIIDAGVGGMAIKTLLVRCINTVDATNTLAITLADYGIATTGFIGILSWVHTTDNSVSALETNTTTVSAGVLTITIASGTDNDARFIMVFGFSDRTATASTL
jgi:hypothetical protein